MTKTYAFTSPILIEVIEEQFESGVVDRYYLHEKKSGEVDNLPAIILETVKENPEEYDFHPLLEEVDFRDTIRSIQFGLKGRMAETRVVTGRMLTTSELNTLAEVIERGCGALSHSGAVYEYEGEVEMEEDDDDGNLVTEPYASKFYVYCRFHHEQFVLMREKEEEVVGKRENHTVKPEIELIGSDENWFVLIQKASRLLKGCGQYQEAKELEKRGKKARNIHEALHVILQYCEVKVTP